MTVYRSFPKVSLATEQHVLAVVKKNVQNSP